MLPQSVICPAPPTITGGRAGERAEIGDLLLHLRDLMVEKIECMPSAVVIRARWRPAEAACPACGTWSSRVHGSYVRQVRSRTQTAGPAGPSPPGPPQAMDSSAEARLA